MTVGTRRRGRCEARSGQLSGQLAATHCEALLVDPVDDGPHGCRAGDPTKIRRRAHVAIPRLAGGRELAASLVGPQALSGAHDRYDRPDIRVLGKAPVLRDLTKPQKGSPSTCGTGAMHILGLPPDSTSRSSAGLGHCQDTQLVAGTAEKCREHWLVCPFEQLCCYLYLAGDARKLHAAAKRVGAQRRGEDPMSAAVGQHEAVVGFEVTERFRCNGHPPAAGRLKSSAEPVPLRSIAIRPMLASGLSRT
jgi:hypothetical protein